MNCALSQPESLTTPRFETYKVDKDVSVHEVWVGEKPQANDAGELPEDGYVNLVVFGGFCEGDETTTMISQNVLSAAAALQVDEGFSVKKPIRVSVINTENYGVVRRLQENRALGVQPLDDIGGWWYDRLINQHELDRYGSYMALKGETHFLGNSLGAVVAQGAVQQHELRVVENSWRHSKIEDKDIQSTLGTDVRLENVFGFAPAGEQEIKQGVQKVLQQTLMVGGLALDAVQGLSPNHTSHERSVNAHIAKNLGNVLLAAMFEEGLIKTPKTLMRILRELPSGSRVTMGERVGHKIVAKKDSAFPVAKNRLKAPDALAMNIQHSSLASPSGLEVFKYYLARIAGDPELAANIAKESGMQLAYAV